MSINPASVNNNKNILTIDINRPKIKKYASDFPILTKDGLRSIFCKLTSFPIVKKLIKIINKPGTKTKTDIKINIELKLVLYSFQLLPNTSPKLIIVLIKRAF